MGLYTDQMSQKISEISPEDDDFAEELCHMAQNFRSFGAALTEFLAQYGFDGNMDDIDAKVDFIKERFLEAGISPLPRNLRKWFTEGKRLEKRRIAFQFCFAFRLNMEECGEFFRKICLQRGFDCHVMEEAVYYYAILKGLTYRETHELLAQIPNVVSGKIDFANEVLYTESIVQELNRFQSKEELLQFFRENVAQFGYNHATAYRYIRGLWSEIAKEDGLAERERVQYVMFHIDKSTHDLQEYLTLAKRKHSTWEICRQILGYYDFDELNESPLFVVESERSLKPILKENTLLHPLAEDSFPDRQGLEAILRGEHKSNELVRKTLILLVFYRFWMTLTLKEDCEIYHAREKDMMRCFTDINRYLADSGYPSLYAGNPYDWIFLFAMQDEYPLETFRYFMRELYVVKKDDGCL